MAFNTKNEGVNEVFSKISIEWLETLFFVLRFMENKSERVKNRSVIYGTELELG